jgi:hypothetical protein
MIVRAITIEVSMVRVTITGIGRINSPVFPLKNISGPNGYRAMSLRTGLDHPNYGFCEKHHRIIRLKCIIIGWVG